MPMSTNQLLVPCGRESIRVLGGSLARVSFKAVADALCICRGHQHFPEMNVGEMLTEWPTKRAIAEGFQGYNPLR